MFEKKKIAGTILFAPWLASYQCKLIIENCNSIDAGAHKVQKIVYDPTLTLIFPIFRGHEKGKLFILQKVGLSAFKEIL